MIFVRRNDSFQFLIIFHLEGVIPAGTESSAGSSVPLSLRREHLAAMQEHYFARNLSIRGRPATFLRGSGAYMFDSFGRAYLDMVR